jgi:hypothetical protein
MQSFIKAAALAALATAAMAGSANAAHFVGGYSVTANTNDPGLKISTQDLPGGIDFNLNSIGQSATADLFKIYTTETDVGADDKVAKAIKVLFSFSSPVAFNGAVNGTTWGSSSGWIQEGKVHWADPVYFDYAGGRLKVTLNDADFNEGWFGLDEGSRDGAKIKATFTLVRGGSAVPEPATWAMMISGFGMAGVALRRRRTAVAA